MVIGCREHDDDYVMARVYFVLSELLLDVFVLITGRSRL